MAGCQQDEQQVPPKLEIGRSHAATRESVIVVPESVKGQWKAVRIAVTDKTTGKTSVHTVPVGGKISLPPSSMVIHVETFLPAFVKEGPKMTSTSNTLKNPAAKVVISEGATVIFNGWLFSLFPNAHAFMHPRYGFTLVDVIPAKR
nr:DUF2155 domain-containing protein [Pelotalea chapellei]